MDQKSVISSLRHSPNALRGEVVIVTGAGGGIGYEAARALLWLGANVHGGLKFWRLYEALHVL